jgi:deoxyribodipyrimidine photolyase-related protein
MTRHLVLVLGDQLDHQASGFDGFDPKQDRIWMAEVREESTHVPSSKQRIAVFLSAMRHFAKELHSKKFPLDYIRLDDPKNTGSLATELARAIKVHRPERLVMTAPGDWRVLKAIQSVAADHALPLDIREDQHFFSTVREFAEHAKGRKQLRLEYWYRELREKTGILMEQGKPAGGQWNFDQENRAAFGKEGPGLIPKPLRFKPDAITCEVIALINTMFADHPGSVGPSAQAFGWPVTRKEALEALNDFIAHRLPRFGLYQDAMWTGEPWLYHAHIASALNLKLLSSKEVVSAAEAAYKQGHAPLAAVEGFIRQILGWREYVRSIYWLNMPDYIERNALGAKAPLPDFFWTGETEMNCLRETIQQTLQTGYAHHIQRLMVTGLYTLLAGIHPKAVHEWYLSVYVDAVEWVELPNVLGMSQYADGGVMASKPYAASGKYIDRMSNYCKSCRFNPAKSTGQDACPITTLYWDFLMRHEALLAKNPRMGMQVRNLSRLSAADRKAIRAQAAQLGVL